MKKDTNLSDIFSIVTVVTDMLNGFFTNLFSLFFKRDQQNFIVKMTAIIAIFVVLIFLISRLT